jgi:hypothetical protein
MTREPRQEQIQEQTQEQEPKAPAPTLEDIAKTPHSINEPPGSDVTPEVSPETVPPETERQEAPRGPQKHQ